MKDQFEVGHAQVCRWLGTLFMQEITSEQLQAYREGAAEPFWDTIASLCDVAKERAGFARAIDQTTEMELRADFTALFLLGEAGNAQPYASIYKQGDDKVQGSPHAEMLARLAKAGLAPQVDANEPADHVSFMLNYLSLVLSGEVTQETHQTFIQEAMMPWVGQWAGRTTVPPARSAVYPLLCQATKKYLSALASG